MQISIKLFLLSLLGSVLLARISDYPPVEQVEAEFRRLFENREKVELDPRSVLAEEGEFMVERGSFAVEAGERVPFVLYKTKDAGNPLPTVLVLHGTGGDKEGERQISMVRELARRDFLAIAFDGRYHGERVPGGANGKQQYEEAVIRAWREKDPSKQKYPFLYETAADLWRIADYLESRPDVDRDRIGVIGFSKGGMEIWLGASVDERYKVAVPAIAIQSFRWQLENDQWQGRAKTIWRAHETAAADLGEKEVNQRVARALWNKIMPGITGEFDCPSMIRMFAPRPLLILSGENDPNCPLPGAKLGFAAAREAYAKVNALDHLKIDLAEGVAHKVTPEQTQTAIAWFERWLLSGQWSVVSRQRVECVAGCTGGPGQAGLGGPATEAQLNEPFGVDFDQEDNWYIVEWHGHRVTRVDPSGKITLVAGTGEKGEGGDGGPGPKAQLNDPHSLYFHDGQIYVADTRNNRVRRIDPQTGIITTIAGTGEAGFSGDGGPATQAKFDATFDLALYGDKLYIADLNNRRVRRVNLKDGIVATVAGNGETGIPEEGAEAKNSPLLDPRAITADAEGNLYILSRRGNALRVVDKEGKIRTLIAPGDFQPDMNGPKHLCVDLEGTLIIADTENHLIRKYSPETRTLMTIAGTGEAGSRLSTGNPLETQLNRPHGVYVHPSGALYISDSANHRVLRLTGW